MAAGKLVLLGPTSVLGQLGGEAGTDSGRGLMDRSFIGGRGLHAITKWENCGSETQDRLRVTL